MAESKVEYSAIDAKPIVLYGLQNPSSTTAIPLLVDSTGKLKVSGLSDYAKLAISITTSDFFTAITNSTLVAGQWYLLTDYQNETPIANSDPVAYTVGAVEQIYLFATSVNTFHPEGISKTYPDEKVYLRQTIPSILTLVDGNDTAVGSCVNFSWESGASIGATTITMDSEHTFSLDLTPAEAAGLALYPDTFYNDCYDNNAGIGMEMSSSNRNDDWEIDGSSINILNGSNEWISNGADLTTFVTDTDSYMYGSFVYDYTWTSTYAELTITPVSSTEFVVGGTCKDEFVNRTDGTYVDIYNAIGEEAYLDSSNYGVDWTYNPATYTITYLGSVDLSTVLAGGTIYSYLEYPIKSFPYGRIVARRNERLNSYIEADYRSQLFRRFKALSTAWAGTGTVGTTYLESGNLYMCLKNTTTTPSSSAVDFVFLGTDDYWLSADMSFQSNTPIHKLSYDSATYYDFSMFDTTVFDAITNPIDLKITAPVTYTSADVVFRVAISLVRESEITAAQTTIYGALFRNNNLSMLNVVLAGNYNYEINSGTISHLWISTYFDRNVIGSLSGSLFNAFQTNNVTKAIYCIGRSYFQNNVIYELDYCRFFGYTANNTMTFLKYSDFLYTGTTENTPCCLNSVFVHTGFTSYNRNYFNYFIGQFTTNKVFSTNFYANTFGSISYTEFYYTVSFNSLVTISANSTIENCKFYGFVQKNRGEAALSYVEVYSDTLSNIFNIKSISSSTVVKVSGGSGYTLGDVLTITSGTSTSAWASGTDYTEGTYVTESGNTYYCLRDHRSAQLAPYSFSSDLSTYSYWLQQMPATVTVTGVSGGVVTSIQLANGGSMYPTGTLNTTGGTGTGCTVSVTTYATRANVNSVIYLGTFSSNQLYAGGIQGGLYHGNFSTNYLYNTYTTNTLNNNITYSVQGCKFWGASFSNNFVNQKMENCTFYQNSAVSFSTFLGYLNNVTVAISKGITTSTCASLGGNSPTVLNVNHNIANSFIADPLGGIGLSTTADMSYKQYLKASDILFGGQATRSISMERHLTSNTAGNNLGITAGGATSGATDKTGGNVVISSGISTGTGSSDITLLTATAGTTGTTDRTPTEKVRVKGSGAVGIGTTAPDKQVEINSATGACLRLTYNDSNGTAANYVDFAVGSSGDLTVTPSGGDTSFVGNVGIGTTSPSEALDVTGNVKATGYKTGTETGITTTQTVVSDVRDNSGQMQKKTVLMTYTNGLLTAQGAESDWTDTTDI